jgi:hypothetical protein
MTTKILSIFRCLDWGILSAREDLSCERAARATYDPVGSSASQLIAGCIGSICHDDFEVTLT